MPYSSPEMTMTLKILVLCRLLVCIYFSSSPQVVSTEYQWEVDMFHYIAQVHTSEESRVKSVGSQCFRSRSFFIEFLRECVQAYFLLAGLL